MDNVFAVLLLFKSLYGQKPVPIADDGIRIPEEYVALDRRYLAKLILSELDVRKRDLAGYVGLCEHYYMVAVVRISLELEQYSRQRARYVFSVYIAALDEFEIAVDTRLVLNEIIVLGNLFYSAVDVFAGYGYAAVPIDLNR